MTKHRIVILYTAMTFFLTGILLLLLLYWSFFPLKVVEIKNEPYPVVNKVVKAGGVLQHVVKYCKYVDIPSTNTKQFINGLVYEMPMTVNDNPKGCHEMIATTTVPPELPPGKYHLRIVKEYHLNPIRTFSVTNDTELFEVVK